MIMLNQPFMQHSTMVMCSNGHVLTCLALLPDTFALIRDAIRSYQDADSPCAASLLCRLRCLEARGWHAISVPHMAWYSMPGLPERAQYLKGLMEAVGWQFS